MVRHDGSYIYVTHLFYSSIEVFTFSPLCRCAVIQSACFLLINSWLVFILLCLQIMAQRKALCICHVISHFTSLSLSRILTVSYGTEGGYSQVMLSPLVKELLRAPSQQPH